MNPFQLMKIECQGSVIIMVCREAGTNERVVVQVPYRPYFYAPEEEVAIAERKKLAYEFGHVGVDGRKLIKIYTDSPGDVGKKRMGFSVTYEADIPYTRRFLIDTGIKKGFRIKGVPVDLDLAVLMGGSLGATAADLVRVIGPNAIVVDASQLEPVDGVDAKFREVLYDIETGKVDDKYSPVLEARAPVTAITLQDNYSRDEFLTLAWHPQQGRPGVPRIERLITWSEGFEKEVGWERRIFGTEKEMLMAWVQYLKDNRPDGLSAWNGHYGFQRKNMGGYDAPYLITRLDNVSIGSRQMSPLNNTKAGFRPARGGNEKGLWECRIDGLQLLDHMTIYQIKEGGFTGMVPFSGLKPVAKKFANIELKKDPDNIENWWLYDFEDFLTYSFRDVDAMVGLRRTQDYTTFARDLQYFVGVEDTDIIFRPSTLVGTQELRLAKQRGLVLPSSRGDTQEDVEVDGGYVIEPRMPGVLDNVLVLDLNRMYVAIMQSGNMSYETVVPADQIAEPESPPAFDSDVGMMRRTINSSPAYTGPYFRIPTESGYVYFRKEPRGITPLALDENVTLRDSFDAKIEQAETPEQKAELKRQRTPVKSLILTSYGATLSKYNRMYNPDVGRAVTGAGREIIKYVDWVCTALGASVIRGDTDSVFILTPPGEDPVEFGLWLEAQLNKSFDDLAATFGIEKHNFQIGLETVFKTFGNGTQKKRYAGIVLWSEGKYAPEDEQEPVIKGLDGIKSDAAPITKEVTKAVVKGMLNRADPDILIDYTRTVFDSICAGTVPLQDVVRGVNLNFDLDNSTSNSHVLAGARRGRDLFGFQYTLGGRVRLIRQKASRVEWVAIPEGEDIPKDLEVDWEYHARSTVLAPLKGVFEWIGKADALKSVQTGSIVTAQAQL